MTRARSVLEKLKEQGEAVLSQISDEIVSSPYFAKAMQGAMKGKEKLDQAVGEALKQMNIPTRSEFRKAMQRIESLEQELAGVKAASAAQAAAGSPGTDARPRPRRPARKAGARKSTKPSE